jgi:hypothetical protein
VAIGINSFIKKLKEQLVRKDYMLKALENLRSGMTAKNADFYTHQEFRDLITNNLAPLIHNSDFKDDPVRYCREIHAEGGYISWAHPFIGNRLRKNLDNFLMQGNQLQMELFLDYMQANDSGVIELLQHLDAIEGYNGLEFGLTSYLAVDLGKALGKPMTAGSDGHDRGQYGKAFMDIKCETDDIKDAGSLIFAMENYKVSYSINRT